MPTISMFFGIIITMYYFDDEQHSTPHIHVKYQGENAVFSIPDGELLAGNIKNSKSKLITAWDRDTQRGFNGKLGISY